MMAFSRRFPLEKREAKPPLHNTTLLHYTRITGSIDQKKRRKKSVHFIFDPGHTRIVTILG